MNRIRSFIAIIAVVMTVSAGLSAQNYASSGKASKPLEQQIYRKLVNVTDYGVFDFIEFEVDGGTVTLTGKINSLGTKGRAASAIKDLPGVTRVVNNLEYLPPSSFDNAIRRRTLAEFINHGGGRYISEIRPEVHIIVENGHITLEGYVASQSDSNLLNILANGVSGVFSVRNNLIVGKEAYR